MNNGKDVFISFSHIDDQPLYEGQPGWVTEFHRHLETRLNKLRGQESQVWRDPRLQGNDLLVPAIERQLRDTRALVSILSPRYVKSDWCRNEMLAFTRMAALHGAFQVGDQVRWFKVLKTPLAKEDLPADFPAELTGYFENLLGYSFFDIDPQSKRPREYSREFGPQAEQLYHAKVYDLAWDICHLLKKLDATRMAAADTNKGGKVVYLAATTADLQSERDQVKRELLERGHLVLGDSVLPWVCSDLKESLRTVLKQCDFSVHLVGSSYGFVPEGTTESIVQLQVGQGAEIAREGRLRRLIRLSPGGGDLEVRQAEFLRFLREDESNQRRTELIEGPFEDFKEVLIEWLRPPPPPQPSAAPRSNVPSAEGTNPPLVYLIGDRIDGEMMDRVDDFLYEHGMEVTRPSYDSGEEEFAEAHRRRLVECDAAVIYYGRASRDWVDMKLMDLAQARGYGRQRDYRAKAVCVAPPDDRGKERFRSRAAELFQFDGQHTEAFLSLVEKIHGHN